MTNKRGKPRCSTCNKTNKKRKTKIVKKPGYSKKRKGGSFWGKVGLGKIAKKAKKSKGLRKAVRWTRKGAHIAAPFVEAASYLAPLTPMTAPFAPALNVASNVLDVV